MNKKYNLNNINEMFFEWCKANLKKQFEPSLLKNADGNYVSVRNLVNGKIVNFAIGRTPRTRYSWETNVKEPIPGNYYYFYYWLKENKKLMTGGFCSIKEVLNNFLFGWCIRVLGDKANYYDYQFNDEIPVKQLSLF